MIVLLAKYYCKPGNGDQVQQYLYEMKSQVEKSEPDCMLYCASRSDDNPDLFFLYEHYADQAAFEGHRETPHFKEIIEGKIIRSGYTPHYIPWNEEGDAAQPASQPIIEVNGKLRFSLPGEPQFPTLTDETILKPTLSWLILADKPGRFDGELGYMTGGIIWEAVF